MDLKNRLRCPKCFDDGQGIRRLSWREAEQLKTPRGKTRRTHKRSRGQGMSM